LSMPLGSFNASFLGALADALNLLGRGHAPRHMAPVLAGASLTALEKDGGDTRPIAVGETLRRLTSKAFCHKLKEEARECLWPLQAGVGSPLGAEAIIHQNTFQNYVDRNRGSPGKVSLSLGFSNAFNTVSREVFLGECQSRTPFAGLAPWARWLYAEPSSPFYFDEIIHSEAGIQQGDAIGPLLFSPALHPLLTRVRGITGVDFTAAYLDDVLIAGAEEAALQAFQFLQREVHRVRPNLNLSKCKVVSLGPDAPSAAFPAEVQRSAQGNVIVLGKAVGTDEFANQYLKEAGNQSRPPYEGSGAA